MVPVSDCSYPVCRTYLKSVMTGFLEECASSFWLCLRPPVKIIQTGNAGLSKRGRSGAIAQRMTADWRAEQRLEVT